MIPGDVTPAQYLRQLDDRLARLERGDGLRGMVRVGSLVIGDVVVTTGEAEGAVALLVRNRVTGQSGYVPIIFFDEG